MQDRRKLAIDRRKLAIIDRPATTKPESPRTVYGLDFRVLRIVYTLAACYLLYLLRHVLLLLALSVVAAYILLPAVENTQRFLMHNRHKGRALAVVFLLVLAVLLSVGGVIGYYAFQQASSLAKGALLGSNAVEHMQVPAFLHPWEAQIRSLIQNWRETHGQDLLET